MGNIGIEDKHAKEREDEFSGDLLAPISISPPNFSIFQQTTNPYPPTGYTAYGKPIQTNKFYGNILTGSQTGSIWTYPYEVHWNKLKNFHGLSVNIADETNNISGNLASNDATNKKSMKFYSTDTHISRIILSAKEFNEETRLTLDSIDQFSINTSFSIGETLSRKTMWASLVQGMGFVTVKYFNLTPEFKSEVGFKSISAVVGKRVGILKYKIRLLDDTEWLLYITLPPSQKFALDTVDVNTIRTSYETYGLIAQIAAYAPGCDDVYDIAAGNFPVSASLDISTALQGNASYSIKYQMSITQQLPNKLLIFALPHHIHSFDSSMEEEKTTLILNSPSKGKMTGYLTRELKFKEKIFTDLQFLPIRKDFKDPFPDQVLVKIHLVVNSEMENPSLSFPTGNLTEDGRIMFKYATLALISKDILQDRSFSEIFTSKLKKMFKAFNDPKNKNKGYALFYDVIFRGVLIKYGIEKLDDDDSGTNKESVTYSFLSRDYGYLIYSAAVLAYVDKALGGKWLVENKEWINILVRNVVGSTSSDAWFPVFRVFDWYHGHSWDDGIEENQYGKMLSSPSEDVNLLYALKLWGRVTGDMPLELRSGLMLAVLKRSLNEYIFLKDKNFNHPFEFVKNNRVGTLYESKVDLNTNFGTKIEQVIGNGVLPLSPALQYFRDDEYISTVWDKHLKYAKHNLRKVNSGWKSLLIADRSSIGVREAKESWLFFSQAAFKPAWLSSSLSRAWALSYSAGNGAIAK